jgi:hypothetical protein
MVVILDLTLLASLKIDPTFLFEHIDERLKVSFDPE